MKACSNISINDLLGPMPERRLLVSFSGGETSAYMARLILLKWRLRYDAIIIVFANTSQEDEKCLRFVDRCDREIFQPLGGRVVWIEAEHHPGQRKGATFRIVDFNTAERSGNIFEDMIQKYGIPNRDYPHCTRELKLNPINAYARSIGWAAGTYDTAIGIRADEIDRMSSKAVARRLVYPLAQEYPTKKSNINTWFASQPFRLELKGYESNCVWCLKKSLRKHLTLIGEKPQIYDFPRRMEEKYGNVGGEFRTRPETLEPGYRRVFFRERRSTDDLFRMYDERGEDFKPAEDDAIVFDAELDTAGGCGEESCEVFTDDEAEGMLVIAGRPFTIVDDLL